MKKQPNNLEPLKAADNRSWISNKPLSSEAEKKLRIYLWRFVYGSEAIGCTSQTRGFIKDLHINTSDKAFNFLSNLGLKTSTARVAFKTCDAATKLGSYLREDTKDGDDFIFSENEFFYMTYGCPAPLSKMVKLLPEFKPRAPLKNGKKRQNKSNYYRIDSFFRHIRNCFAHGQCTVRNDNAGGRWWALQDSNAKGNVTFRALVRESTIDGWVKLISDRDSNLRRPHSKRTR